VRILSRFRPLLPALLLPITLACGCNSGGHPGQLRQPAPDFVIQNGSETVSLAQYRGQIVVLNFWASWCPPCLEEFRSLIQLQRQLPNIKVLAVSFDQDPQAYQQFLLDNHIAGVTTVVDPSQKSNLAFGTTRPPETYVIDRHGVIRRKFIGAQDWTNPEIENYLRHLGS
jgi:cytochrome c biogenesis protein CcmG, thiol:disulfide interchange protein DsbE